LGKPTWGKELRKEKKGVEGARGLCKKEMRQRKHSHMLNEQETLDPETSGAEGIPGGFKDALGPL